MIARPLVSILINNYNYGRFLGDAIDSALNQTYPNIEVIVVDDGSTDDSREVIASYGDRIIPILKENGGQASAFNAGFEASKGDIICFLDADDLFLPEKVQRVAEYIIRAQLVSDDILVYHDLEIVDADGVTVSARREPPIPRWHGNYYDFARKHRFVPHVASFPSGVTVTHNLACRIFPLPEGFPSGGDVPLIRAAGLLGAVRYIDVALSKYRAHGQNRWYGSPGEKPRAFWEMVEQFLNQRLVEAGKQPVIRMFDSTFMRWYYEKERDVYHLLRLAFIVPFYRPTPNSFRFAARTIIIAVSLLITERSTSMRKYPRRGH